MKKLFFIALFLGLTTVTTACKSEPSMMQRFKVTVAVETPEGIVTGSAVRQIGNAASSVRFPGTGNPAGVRGEAVVVDLGERGVLFALISHHSDNEFYNAFPVPGNRIGIGGASATGIAYYKTLKPGDKGILDPKYFPGYPKMVTFKDMDDPKSVTLVQEKKRDDRGYYYLAADHMEELFGEGVKLKDITFEITGEPVTWGEVDKWLPIGARKLNMTYNYFSKPNKTALK